jgi:hypothetical protein
LCWVCYSTRLPVRPRGLGPTCRAVHPHTAASAALLAPPVHVFSVTCMRAGSGGGKSLSGALEGVTLFPEVAV